MARILRLRIEITNKLSDRFQNSRLNSSNTFSEVVVMWNFCWLYIKISFDISSRKSFWRRPSSLSSRRRICLYQGLKTPNRSAVRTMTAVLYVPDLEIFAHWAPVSPGPGTNTEVLQAVPPETSSGPNVSLAFVLVPIVATGTDKSSVSISWTEKLFNREV